MNSQDGPRVVTIGGGHGQAALLAALVTLRCDITAVVSVADDGGCSGQIRRQFGMPPPGDLRRCLTTLARDCTLASRFELRLLEPGEEGRSAGNLALTAAFREYGSLQRAVDWAAEILQCCGRVVPVAESPGVLMVYDMVAGEIAGESHVEHSSSRPVVVTVDGPTETNPVAVEALEQAEIIFFGPGSFFTSTLATLTTASVAEAVGASQARRILLTNLAPEGGQTAGFTDLDYVRLLRDHLIIATRGEHVDFSILRHSDGDDSVDEIAPGTIAYSARLSRSGECVHDQHLLAQALMQHFGFSPREHDSSTISAPMHAASTMNFEEHLAAARRMLQSGRDD